MDKMEFLPKNGNLHFLPPEVLNFRFYTNWQLTGWLYIFSTPPQSARRVCRSISRYGKNPTAKPFPPLPYTTHISSYWIFIHFYRIFHTTKYDNFNSLIKTLFYYFYKIHNYVYLCFEITAYSFIFFRTNLYLLNLYYKNTHFLLTIHTPYAILYTY